MVGIGVAILVLSGCAAKPSVSEYQCMAGDWQSIGYRDGSQGLARSQVLKHAEACGEYGVVPDLCTMGKIIGIARDHAHFRTAF